MQVLATLVLLLVTTAMLPGRIGSAAAQTSLPSMPGEESEGGLDDRPIETLGVEIEQLIGSKLPLHLEFTDSEGQSRPLSDYFDGAGGRPVILNLGYYECPLLCPQVEAGLIQAAQNVRLNPYEDYLILSVSIDHRESPALAAEAKQGALQRLRMTNVEDGWKFLTGSKENIAELAAAAGFGYRDAPQQQIIVHGATLIFVQPDGTISSYLKGVNYPATQYRLALVDAGEGRLGNIFDQITLFCSAFNPEAGRYVRIASRVMTLAGAGMLLLLIVSVIGLFILEKNRDKFMSDKTA